MVHMLSPADPLFWMHHSNVDRYYALWQEKNPSIRNDYPTDPERTRLIYYTDSMVSSVFKTDSVSQCYVYSRGLAQRKSSLTKREVLDDYGTIYNEEDAELIQDFSQVPDFNSEDALHDPQDRDDQNKLRSARPLPESWISMNKMDIIKVRRLEYHHALINIKANELIRLGKYTSQVSLQNKKMDFASAVHSLDIVGDFIKKFDIHHFKLNAMKKAKESVKNEIPVGLDDLKDVPL